MRRILCYIFVLCFIASCSQNNTQEDYVIDGNSILIDVRTDNEYRLGHLENAINIPYNDIRDKIREYVTDENERIIVYCRSGRRSGIAEKTLREMGYPNVINAGSYEVLKKREMGKEKKAA